MLDRIFLQYTYILNSLSNVLEEMSLINIVIYNLGNILEKIS